MTLERRIKELIASDGPQPVSVYMALCLHDPQHGYYATRPGLARDFRTAPETSQAFGELLGLWAAHEWAALGRPSPFTLAEIGPGRGTLMTDALRALAVAPDMLAAMDLVLVEPSPVLRRQQSGALAGHAHRHVTQLDALPEGPLILIGNEYLDCLPARQFVRDGDTWRERVVGLSQQGELEFGLAVERAEAPTAAPSGGVEVDVQPGLETVVKTLAARPTPFRALFIDYGPADTAPGDTLRAFRDGRQIDPLAAPGASDLTVDVDFARLTRLAARAGLCVAGPVAQGPFLMSLGLQTRLDQLIAANPDRAEALYAGAASLADPAQMGARFKAVCLSSPGLPPPAGLVSTPEEEATQEPDQAREDPNKR